MTTTRVGSMASNGNKVWTKPERVRSVHITANGTAEEWVSIP